MTRADFLPLARPSVGHEEIAAVTEVLNSGYWTTGPKVAEFEREFAAYINESGSIYTVALNSCTSGLYLSLLALGIGAGDEVIVPTWTFAATAHVVEWAGAVPVLCDIEEDTLNIDVQMAERLITKNTKAIMPVHMAGYPCDMDAIARLSEKYGIYVIEDAAHAVGTKYKGQKIGNFSTATVFSFYATKNLAMGEGGLVASKDERLIEEIRKLSYFGINKDAFKRYEKRGTWFYDIEGIGYKCNLDSIHAAVGLVQLRKLDVMNERRRAIARSYKDGLSAGISLVPGISDTGEHLHTYHLFPVLIPASINRDTLITALRDRNIGTSVHFRPLHMHSHYKGRTGSGQFPVAEGVFPRVLSLPMFPSMTDEDVRYVITNINELVGS
ncbi:DegT/DnrJ/EryC1/StrS family aminotransferase [Candidatus Magnetominusculus dajiuhuensis]|uniref:DegT/DnrJ/EryC1/StrS family aminotransferase n=1 Tax=Candidatus Magnetominusculus dajiuhuensis TaxID=3137712 RepID=UPI003B435503